MRAAKFSSCRLMVIALVGWCQLFWDLCMLWGEGAETSVNFSFREWNSNICSPLTLRNNFFFSFLFSSWNRQFIHRNIFPFSSQKIWFSLGRAGPKLVWCKAFGIFRAFANLFSFINATPRNLSWPARGGHANPNAWGSLWWDAGIAGIEKPITSHCTVERIYILYSVPGFQVIVTNKK